MRSCIRLLVDHALLVITLVSGGLVLYLAAPRSRLRPVVHPVACHACSANAPPAVVAASDAYLTGIGAIEMEAQE
jgi:hypothetical protein